MEIALPVTNKTVFAEATVGEDGALHLNNPCYARRTEVLR